MIKENSQSPQPNRSSLIARLRKNNPTDSILKRDNDDPAPLSYSQERLWIMSQLEPDNPIYNVAGAVRFNGILNVLALEQALTKVVHRHHILRSRFITVEATPRQQVIPDALLALEMLDLSTFFENEKMSAFNRYADVFIRRPFKLDKQLPLRALLTKLDNQQHILLLTLHHMVSDRWSVGVLMQEVAALYEAFCSNRPSPLPALPIQYADYCMWQRHQHAKWDSQLAYWQQKLAGVPPLLELPTDRHRPVLQSYRGDIHCFELSMELSQKLKQLAQQYNVTLFMVMAAAYSTLLYRYSNSHDFCIGYPVAGRNRSQTNNLIGFFVNTLVLRCQMDGEMRFSDWLAKMREQALQDQNHQELAFGQLLEALNPPRNTSHAPLFQVMLAVQNVPTADFKMSNLEVMPLTMNNGISQFDQTLFVDEQAGQLLCTFEYSLDLFDAPTIKRMAEHLQTLLEQAVATPNTSIHQLDILPFKQRQQILLEFNDTVRDYSQKPAFIHALFEAQVKRNPDAIALRCEDENLSYAELNAKANQLAHALIERGVKPDMLVGICLERSPEMVVGLLGILKAGGAYVPLDPAYPSERLQFILADSTPAVLISERRLLVNLPTLTNQKICTVLLDDITTTTQSTINPDSTLLGLMPSHLAYVIYTSGSTGQPKGAMNQHNAVVNRLLWAQDEYQLTAADKVMQKTPFSFDVSVWEFFLPLLAGAELILAKPKGHQEPDYLQALIASAGITMLHFVPSMLQAFLTQLDMDKCRTLRQILCSGETLPLTLQRKCQQLLPSVTLHNLYGPTEAAIDVTACLCRHDDTVVSIGKPIANTRIYILDSQFQPVPIGVTGEIYIGGIAVGRGYLNNSILTDERFLANPFIPGCRLYKTGDLGRFFDRWAY